MARTSDRASIRKQEILDHFYEVIATEGLEGASNAKIARHMNINQSLIYHYFSSREEMIVELVRYLTEKYQGAFAPILDGISEPGERLRRGIDIAFSRDWVQFIDMGVFYSCYALSFRNERVRQSLQEMYFALHRWLLHEIRSLMESGHIVKTDPEKLADTLISLLEGYDFYRCLMQDEERFDELGQFLKERALAMLQTDKSTRAEGPRGVAD
ncbi:MAG TPA: TetR family transcriptional regulator C-terminal domain-containing protein [Candidatus Anoxymicrobiaceae bacterium]|jgi:AcrR family transcriptional regulator